MIKKYTEEEARAMRRQIPGTRSRLMGWVWRKHAGTARWVFTTTLDGRSYPSKAQFVPVYVEEEG